MDISSCPIIHHICTPNNLTHVHASPAADEEGEEEEEGRKEENNAKSMTPVAYR